MEYIKDQNKRIAHLQQEVVKHEDNKKFACSILKYGLALGLVSLCMFFPKLMLSDAHQEPSESVKIEQQTNDLSVYATIGTTLSVATIATAGTIASKEDEKLSKARRELQHEYE